MQWHDTVRELRLRKLELARLDPRGGMPIQPPSGAAEHDLVRVEHRLGRQLPPSYRAFLLAQDGWPRFFQGAALFGVLPLARGTFVDVACMVLQDAELAGGASAASLLGAREDAPSSRERPAFIPFGMDSLAETVVAWDLGAERAHGELEVVVHTNGLSLHVDDFPSFLELCLDMLCAEIVERRALGRCGVPAKPASTVDRRSRAA